MRLFTVLLVATLALLMAGTSFAAETVIDQQAIDTSIQRGEAAEMTVALMDSGVSSEVAATRMVQSGAGTQDVERGLTQYRNKHRKKHRHHHHWHRQHDGNGNDNCVSP